MKLLLTLAAIAFAGVVQAQAWDTNTVNWSAPTTCTSGQPISNCPVTNYRVERSTTTIGIFAAVGTSTTTTYTHTSAQGGQNCYRVVAISATGESVPSNVACKTNVQPAGPPNPPTGVTIVVAVAQGHVSTPVFAVLKDGSRSSTVAGLAHVGVACDGPVLFRYRNKDWRHPTDWQPWSTSALTNVAAPCG